MCLWVLGEVGEGDDRLHALLVRWRAVPQLARTAVGASSLFAGRGRRVGHNRRCERDQCTNEPCLDEGGVCLLGCGGGRGGGCDGATEEVEAAAAAEEAEAVAEANEIERQRTSRE